MELPIKWAIFFNTFLIISLLLYVYLLLQFAHNAIPSSLLDPYQKQLCKFEL